MDWIAGEDIEPSNIIAADMQDLDSTRHEFETQAQAFSRRHDTVVTVVLACSIILIVSGVWWMSIFVILIGVVIISILKTRKLTAERHISQINREIRQKSLEILSNGGHGLS